MMVTTTPGAADRLSAWRPPCSDCGALCELTILMSLGELQTLKADLAAAQRKVVCGSCLPGGPVVVRVVEARAPVSVAEVLEAVVPTPVDVVSVAEVLEAPAKPKGGVPFSRACSLEGLAVSVKTNQQKEALRALLLARGWTTKQTGARRWLWFQPAPHERHTW